MKRILALAVVTLTLVNCRDVVDTRVSAVAPPLLSHVSSSSWTPIARMSVPRGDHASATGLDGRIYVIGGCSNVGCTAPSEAYDPRSGTWSPIAGPPGGRFHASAARGGDGRIYLVGGATASGGATTDVQAYDVTTNTWTAVAPLSTVREYAAVAVGQDGRIYAFGGYAGGDLKTAERYDPALDRWEPIASMSVARRGAAAATDSDGRIYLFGGVSATGQPLTLVEAYDPAVDEWSINPLGERIAQMPYPGYFLTAVAAGNGHIYVVGNQLVHTYEPANNLWTQVASLNENWFLMYAAGTAGPDGRIYITGGFDDFNLMVLDEAASYETVPPPVTVSIRVVYGYLGGVLPRGTEGILPVNLYGSPTFDVSQVDIPTVEFGGQLRDRYFVYLRDANGDGILDLGMGFEAEGITNRFPDGTSEVCLTGRLLNGAPFRGCEMVTIVSNRSPVASAGGPYTGIAGSAVTFDASASSDPDGDPLSFSWDFGDGSSGSGATPSHTYASAGPFSATVTVSDGNGGSGNASATVTIQTPAGAAGEIGNTIDDLVEDGLIPPTVAGPLTSSTDAAAASLESGNETAATGQLGAFINKVMAAIKNRSISAEVGAELIAFANRVLASIGG